MFKRYNIKDRISFFIANNYRANNKAINLLILACSYNPYKCCIYYIGYILNLIAKAYLFSNSILIFKKTLASLSPNN